MNKPNNKPKLTLNGAKLKQLDATESKKVAGGVRNCGWSIFGKEE